MKKFQTIACLIIILLLASSLVACSPTDKYVVTIHPNNGGANIQWNINETLPTFEKTGFEIEGYYLDSDFTAKIIPESLKATGLTSNIDIYIKWSAVEPSHQHTWGNWIAEEDGTTHTRVCAIDNAHTETANHIDLDENQHCDKCDYYLVVECEHSWSPWFDVGDGTCARFCYLDAENHFEQSEHVDGNENGECDKCRAVVGATVPEYNAEFIVPEGGYDGSPVTITFYHTMGANLSTVLDNYIYTFRSMYPYINVEHQAVGSYNDVKSAISSGIATGNVPNVAYCYPDHVALYNQASAVVQLDDLIASTETVTLQDGTTEILGLTQTQKEDFIQGYYNAGLQFDGEHMYSLPFSKSTEVLYYNKTFFDQHGLSVPTTWDEMETLCARILEIDPTCIPLGYDSESNLFITLCQQLGSPYTSSEEGNHYLFNNQTNVEFLKRLRNWYNAGYITTQNIYGGYTSGLFTATSGTKCYMSIASSAGALHQRPNRVGNDYIFEVGVASIPQVDPVNPQVISQGPDLCIFSKSNPQEVIASWLFIKFLTTYQAFQAEFSMVSGYVPVIKSVTDNPVYADFLQLADGGAHLVARVAQLTLSQQSAYFTNPAFPGSSLAREQVGFALTQAMASSLPAGQTVDEYIKSLLAAAEEECRYLYD